MKHYVVPTLEQKPDLVILHCGTNDLRTKEPNEISKNIVDLARTVSEQSENTGVVVSGVIRRGDELNGKVLKVNEILEKLCNECNIGYINNGNNDPEKHLNKSRLHLNIDGTNKLESNLRNLINC
uniref:SGNH hydrolase-type esterase domain-containing protein n=1 Tax=Clytia hemisphaerica TaxID=252671 RepID=A0A7M5X0H8_9CNID